MEKPFRVEPLSKEHDKGSFSCGTQALDNYLKTQAGQDVKKYLAKCFVAVENNTNLVIGFYTLSAGSVPLNLLPPEVAKTIRYSDVPVTILGRFAVTTTIQSRGIGTALLFYACNQAMNAPIGSVGIVVDAKEEKIKDWYIGRDFEVIESLRLILTFKRFSQLLQSNN
jgi:hypothetical protein